MKYRAVWTRSGIQNQILAGGRFSPNSSSKKVLHGWCRSHSSLLQLVVSYFFSQLMVQWLELCDVEDKEPPKEKWASVCPKSNVMAPEPPPWKVGLRVQTAWCGFPLKSADLLTLSRFKYCFPTPSGHQALTLTEKNGWLQIRMCSVELRALSRALLMMFTSTGKQLMASMWHNTVNL